MRLALIAIAGQPRDAARAEPLRVAGKTLARRQLDFALAAGCERIIALGDGASEEAIGLRDVAEAAGARFDAIRDGHGLLGAVRANDELLALAPGLLPESAEALAVLVKGHSVLVLPAGPGTAAGFERIDAERAWAGAVVVPGASVEKLAGLAADIDPASALVRIALQARVAERRLPEEAVAGGGWSLVAEGAQSAGAERAWLVRNLPKAEPWDLTRWLANRALLSLASSLLAARHAAAWLSLTAVTVLAAAILAAWYGFAALGLALVAPGAVAMHLGAAMQRLGDAPFGQARRLFVVAAILPWLVDAAILACAVLAIEGTWLHRLFPPLVLLGALHLGRRGPQPRWMALPRDRGALAVILAVTAAFGAAEPGFMLVSLALIALDAANSATKRG